MADRGAEFEERDIRADPRAEQALRKVLHGRLMTPTLVAGGEVLIGFAQNRARLEELFPKKKEEQDGA